MKWKRKLLRLHELKKKERATIARSIELRAKYETLLARKEIMKREKHLVGTAEHNLPEMVDKLARLRQMARRKK